VLYPPLDASSGNGLVEHEQRVCFGHGVSIELGERSARGEVFDSAVTEVGDEVVAFVAQVALERLTSDAEWDVSSARATRARPVSGLAVARNGQRRAIATARG